jgi:hypothetical protein
MNIEQKYPENPQAIERERQTGWRANKMLTGVRFRRNYLNSLSFIS